MSFGIRRLVRTAAVFAGITVMAAATTRDAHASAGCNAVKAGGFDVATGDQGGNDLKTISDFAVGDTVYFNIKTQNGVWNLSTGSDFPAASVSGRLMTGTEDVWYPITGNNSDTTLTQRIQAEARTVVNASCWTVPAR
jgi:hypothetical protein